MPIFLPVASATVPLAVAAASLGTTNAAAILQASAEVVHPPTMTVCRCSALAAAVAVRLAAVAAARLAVAAARLAGWRLDLHIAGSHPDA